MSDIPPLAIPPTAPVAAPMSAVAVARMPADLAGMAAGTILTGVVVGREPGGLTVIRTQHGALAIKGASLPTGGTVTLQLQQTGAQLQVVILSVDGGAPPHREAPPAAPAPQGAAPTLQPQGPPSDMAGEAVRMLSGHWDALAKTLAAAPGLKKFVPRSGPEWAALALAFVGALKRGALADWIGRDGLRGVPAPLADQLADDFTRMARLAANEPGAWRFVPIPFLCEHRLEQALVFVRNGQRHPGDHGDESGTRILMEIENARFGRIQIDALMRPYRLDLIVRSHAELPLDMRTRIAFIHDEARDIASLAGAVGFQHAGTFVPLPLATDHLGLTA